MLIFCSIQKKAQSESSLVLSSALVRHPQHEKIGVALLLLEAHSRVVGHHLVVTVQGDFVAAEGDTQLGQG